MFFLEKKIVGIFLVALALFFSGCTTQNPDSNSGNAPVAMSPQEIYSAAKESIFLVEYDCNGTVEYPVFDINYTYTPENDHMQVNAVSDPNLPKKRFDTSLVYTGTAFVAEGKFFTSAHVIEECTQDGFSNNVRDNLSSSYYYFTPERVESATSGQFDSNFVRALADGFVADLNKDYNTGLDAELVSGAVSQVLLQYIATYGDVNLTKQSMLFSPSGNKTGEQVSPRLLSKGESWPKKDFAILDAGSRSPD